MRVVYPVTIEVDDEDYYLVHSPDFDSPTFGKDLAEALYMAEDMISLLALDMIENGKELPTPTSIEEIPQKDGVIVTLVMGDITAYKAKLDNRAVRKNLTIPSWLNVEAEKAHLNFSQVLQEALKERLGLA